MNDDLHRNRRKKNAASYDASAFLWQIEQLVFMRFYAALGAGGTAQSDGFQGRQIK